VMDCLAKELKRISFPSKPTMPKTSTKTGSWDTA
jgi:hypothetical protein